MSTSTEQYIEYAINHYKAARYQEGLIACEYAIQLDPTFARAYHGRGLILAKQKKYKEALEDYQRSCEIESKNAKLHADMGELFYILNDYEKSCLSYQKAIQLERLCAKVPNRLCIQCDILERSHCKEERPA